MRHKFLILVILILIFIVVHSTEAQIIFGQKGYFSSSVIYTGWNIKGTEEVNLHEWVGVVRVFLPLSDNFELSYFSTGAATNLTHSSSSRKKLSGVNDARIQGAYSFLDDAFLLTLGVNIPTGKKSLTTDEIEVANMLADNSMRFPVRRYGEGLNFSTGLVFAKKIGGLIFGLGGGYLLNGKYALLASTSDKYKPGDETSLSIGVDMKRVNTLLRFDGTYTHFSQEKFGGVKAFQKGSMGEISALLNHSRARTSFYLSVNAIFRGKDRLLNESGFSYEFYNSHVNEYRGDLSANYVLTNSLGLRGFFEIRSVAANKYPSNDPFFVGASHFYGGGAGCDFKIIPKITLNLSAKYFAGKTNGNKDDLRGVNAEAGLTFGFK